MSFHRFFVISSLLSLLYILFLPAESFPQTMPSSSLPVEITADRLTHDKATDTYVAEGHAIVIQGGMKIEADRVVYKRARNEAIATGNVVVTDEKGNVARGRRLELNTERGTGVMESGTLFYKPVNLHIKGNRLIKSGKERYEVKRGRFTTCDCTPPAWSFTGSDVKVTVGEYLTSKNTLFYIKRIPVLYTPYMIISVKRGRQTGFLRPGLGYSDLKGFSMYNAFFWAISRSTDATFYLDYEAERGVGEGIEYRYIRRRGSEGSFFIYHFKEKDIERLREFRTLDNNLNHPQDAEDDRWQVRYKHREDRLPLGFSMDVNINEVSDDEYFLDFYKDLSERTLQKLESNITISRGFGKFNLVGQLRFFDDLLKDNDKGTLQRVPQITLTGSSIEIPHTPLYFSLDSTYINFRRRSGIDGSRLDMHPSVSLPLKPWGLFELTPKAGFRDTRYVVSEGERNRERDIYDLSLNLETTFIRIYHLSKESKLRHTIRPQVTYSYIPDRYQDDLPSFDDIDRIAKENKIKYTLTSIFTGRTISNGKKTYYDYLFFKLTQSYDINEARRTLQLGEKRRPFSVVSGELNALPFEGLSLNLKGDFNPYSRRFDKYITTLGFSDNRNDRLDLSYDYTRGSANYLDISVNLRISRGLQAFHRSRFAHKDPNSNKDFDTLETVFGLKYESQCWGVEVSRTERPDERVIMASINLLGLGEIARIRANYQKEKADEKQP